MSDLLRIVNLPDNGRKRPVVLLDLADGVNFTPTRGSQTITPPAKRASSSTSDRRYGGSREVGSAHENGAWGRSFYVKGGTAQAVMQNIERLVAQTEDFVDKYIEWRPDGTARSVYFELRGLAAWAPKYAWEQFVGALSLEIDVTVPIAPLARGDHLDYTEDFSAGDPLADFTVDSGSAVNFAYVASAWSGGAGWQLTITGTEQRLVHTARGHRFAEHEETRGFIVGATLNGFKGGTVLKRVSSTYYLDCYVDDDGVTSRLKLDVVTGGTAVNRISQAITRISAQFPLYVRARLEGDVVTVEAWSTRPTPAGTPDLGGPYSYTLTDTEAANFGPSALGRGGLSLKTPAGLPAPEVIYWESRPLTYYRRSLPEEIAMRGVPGSAPPSIDMFVTATGGATAAVFALLGINSLPGAYSPIWNGGFAANASGWTVAAVAGYTAAATSIARQATGGPINRGPYGQVTVPATANSGTAFKVYRRFKRGRRYVINMWASSQAGTLTLKVGNEAGTDQVTATLSGVSFSTRFLQFTLAWTPTADTDVAYVSVSTATATAGTFGIGAIVLYEADLTTTADPFSPISTQGSGSGAVPPQGIIKAESQDPTDLSTWAITADANYLGGYGLKVTTAGAGSAQSTYYVDPSLLPDDAFLSGIVHVEVWAVVELAAGLASPRINLSAFPETTLGAERYTAEYGAVGKALTRPSTGTVKRKVRLGTLRLPTNDGVRWKLRLAATWGNGSSGLYGVDYLVLVPARRRAVSPSGKANDSAYPKFTSSTAEITRRILSDLRGQTIREPGYPYSDTGLGGTLLEGPPPPPTPASVKYAPTVLTEAALAGYWRLEETSGTNAADSKGAGGAGTYGAAVTLGLPGLLSVDSASRSVSMDGTVNARITTGYTPFVAGQPITVEGIALRADNVNQYALFGGLGTAGNRPGLAFLAGGNQISYWAAEGTGGASVTWTSPVGPGQAFHWALVIIPGTSAELFINGVSLGVQAYATAFTASPGAIQFGAFGPTGAGAYYFKGQMDELAVYSTAVAGISSALSQARIAAHYDAAVGNLTANLQDLELIAKLSSLVPDDPTSDATTEQLAHTATVHASVVPRYYLARPT